MRQLPFIRSPVLSHLPVPRRLGDSCVCCAAAHASVLFNVSQDVGKRKGSTAQVVQPILLELLSYIICKSTGKDDVAQGNGWSCDQHMPWKCRSVNPSAAWGTCLILCVNVGMILVRSISSRRSSVIIMSATTNRIDTRYSPSSPMQLITTGKKDNAKRLPFCAMSSSAGINFSCTSCLRNSAGNQFKYHQILQTMYFGATHEF